MDLLATHLFRPWWALVSSVAPWMLAVFVLERAFSPRLPDARAAALNVRFILTALAVQAVLLEASLRPAAAPLLEALRAPLAPLRSWLAAGLPLALQFVLSVAAIDFFYYWTHRLQHRVGWLWRVHELHHSDPSFNVTTTLRVHWLEELMKALTVAAPAAMVIDAPGALPWLLAAAGAVWLFFIHADVPISFGPLNRVFVNPSVHRVHHSREPAHHDRNFAAYFSLWDVLFGTYCEPPRGRRPAVGTDGEPPANAWQAHLRPWQRPRPAAGAVTPAGAAACAEAAGRSGAAAGAPQG